MATYAQIKSDFNKLSIGDRIELLYDLWDALATEPGAVDLRPEQERELEQRYQRHLANPDEAIPWEEVRTNIRAGRPRS